MATNVTHTQLQNLIDNSSLVAGEIYVITDYQNYNLSITAISESELSDEAHNYSARDNLVFHYVPATNEVDYMKDTYRKIEGNFDWTDNIENCYDVHLSNSTNLIVKDSTGVFVDDTVEGSVSNSQNIFLGNGCNVQIDGCFYLTIGGGNTLTLDNCTSVDFGRDNELTLDGVEKCSIAHNNKELSIDGVNVIGSNNRGIIVEGDSNVIKSDNINIELYGECNSIDRTKYFDAYGSYNVTDKTTLATLDTAYANEVRNSHSIDIKNTNNNIVRTDAIQITDKPAFVQYATVGSVTSVSDLAERVNMQADSTATTLIVDEQMMWQTPQTKDNKHYVIVDGQWVNVE